MHEEAVEEICASENTYQGSQDLQKTDINEIYVRCSRRYRIAETYFFYTINDKTTFEQANLLRGVTGNITDK